MEVKPRVVLPEGNDERIQAAVSEIVGNEWSVHLMVIDGPASLLNENGSRATVENVSRENLEQNVLEQAAQMVNNGQADAVVAGADHSTPDVLRAYIKLIGTQEGVARVTSCFLMEKGEQRYLFADCGVNIDPTAENLAETAYLCHQFAALVDIVPKIAFLSFSTKGSAAHGSVEKVLQATESAKSRYPEMIVDGELQLDAAIVPEVAAKKAPDSQLHGEATVLIFPDLNAGNIAYKITERFGGYRATGPLLLGLRKPAHDLSRGCSAADVVSAVQITLKQCNQAKVAHETK